MISVQNDFGQKKATPFYIQQIFLMTIKAQNDLAFSPKFLPGKCPKTEHSNDLVWISDRF